MLNIGNIIGKFIKNSSQREIDSLNLIVKQINELEPKIKKMSDESFPIKTKELKSKFENGTKRMLVTRDTSGSYFRGVPPSVGNVCFLLTS